jgi:hypothetical protein
MNRLNIELGQQFGRLKAIRPLRNGPLTNHQRWLCQCECLRKLNKISNDGKS